MRPKIRPPTRHLIPLLCNQQGRHVAVTHQTQTQTLDAMVYVRTVRFGRCLEFLRDTFGRVTGTLEVGVFTDEVLPRMGWHISEGVCENRAERKLGRWNRGREMGRLTKHSSWWCISIKTT
jgi:hypothetical protein